MDLRMGDYEYGAGGAPAQDQHLEPAWDPAISLHILSAPNGAVLAMELLKEGQSQNGSSRFLAVGGQQCHDVAMTPDLAALLDAQSSSLRSRLRVVDDDGATRLTYQ